MSQRFLFHTPSTQCAKEILVTSQSRLNASSPPFARFLFLSILVLISLMIDSCFFVCVFWKFANYRIPWQFVETVLTNPLSKFIWSGKFTILKCVRVDDVRLCVRGVLSTSFLIRSLANWLHFILRKRRKHICQINFIAVNRNSGDTNCVAKSNLSSEWQSHRNVCRAIRLNVYFIRHRSFVENGNNKRNTNRWTPNFSSLYTSNVQSGATVKKEQQRKFFYTITWCEWVKFMNTPNSWSKNFDRLSYWVDVLDGNWTKMPPFHTISSNYFNRML